MLQTTVTKLCFLHNDVYEAWLSAPPERSRVSSSISSKADEGF